MRKQCGEMCLLSFSWPGVRTDSQPSSRPRSANAFASNVGLESTQVSTLTKKNGRQLSTRYYSSFVAGVRKSFGERARARKLSEAIRNLCRARARTNFNGPLSQRAYLLTSCASHTKSNGQTCERRAFASNGGCSTQRARMSPIHVDAC